MSVMRIHKNSNFTVMSNYHFKERGLSLKAKGLLSLMLSLPDDWNYTVSGLVKLSKDGKDGVMSALVELEKFGYLTRQRIQNDKGQFSGIEYNIFEQPQREKPLSENPISDYPIAEKPTQLNTNNILNTKELNTDNLYILDYENILNKKVSSQQLKDLYTEYIELREDIEAPLNDTGLIKLINRCERLSNGDIGLQHAMIEAAIINNWKNVYLPNEQDKANNTTKANLTRFYQS